MDLVNLISKSPDLFEQLKSLGLNSDEVVGIAGEMNRQLRSREGPDLTDCLSRLDVQGFLDMLDLDDIARQTGVDASATDRAMRLIAPVVQTFDGDLSSVVGRLAGRLFTSS